MTTNVFYHTAATDDTELIIPIDLRIEAEKADEAWEYGEWGAYVDDQWQTKGHYLWLPDSKRIGICTNGDSQWADANSIEHGLDMFVNDPEAYESAN